MQIKGRSNSRMCVVSHYKEEKSGTRQAMEVVFSLVVNSSSPGEDVEEKSEAILFQMQYAVATGQFQIALNGMNSTADRSSLQHLFSNVTCAAGFVTSADPNMCG